MTGDWRRLSFCPSVGHVKDKLDRTGLEDFLRASEQLETGPGLRLIQMWQVQNLQQLLPVCSAEHRFCCIRTSVLSCSVRQLFLLYYLRGGRREKLTSVAIARLIT